MQMSSGGCWLISSSRKEKESSINIPLPNESSASCNNRAVRLPFPQVISLFFSTKAASHFIATHLVSLCVGIKHTITSFSPPVKASNPSRGFMVVSANDVLNEKCKWKCSRSVITRTQWTSYFLSGAWLMPAGDYLNAAAKWSAGVSQTLRGVHSLGKDFMGFYRRTNYFNPFYTLFFNLRKKSTVILIDETPCAWEIKTINQSE